MGAPAGLCIVGGQCDGYVLWAVYCWRGVVAHPVHSSTRLCVVGRYCGQPCSPFDTFMCCWEVLWLCDVGEVVVLFGGSWVVG